MAAMNLSRALILRFMVDYLGIAAVTAGLLFGVAKLFDAATDPAMGWISDHTHSRMGRRHPYMLAGAFLCGGAYMLLFNVPDFASQFGLIVWMQCALLFFSLAFTIFSVPYLSLTIDIAPQYHLRSYLLSYRALGVAMGGLIGGVMGPTVIAMTGQTRESHELMSMLVGAGITAAMLLAFFSTRGVTTGAPAVRDRSGWKDKLTSILANHNFLVLVCSKFCFYTGIAMLNSSGAFFTRHLLQAPDTLIALFFLCFFGCTVAGQPLWLRLGRRYTKHRLFMVFALLFSAVNLTWAFASPEETRLLFALRACLLGASFGGILVMGQSMLPDTIEYDRNTTGLKREGLYAGIFSFAEKGATALGVFLVGMVLGMMGYVESSAQSGIEQTPQALHAIYLCFSVFPAILVPLGAACLSCYRLNEQMLIDSRRNDAAVSH